MNTMEYKGFTARIEYDGEDEVFFGRLLGLRAVVSFHADTVAKLKREMHVAVNEYVASCERRGEAPEKPLSGNVPLRMPPDVHGRAAVLAEASGKSLNQLITELVEGATRQPFVADKMHRASKSAAPGMTVRSMADEFISVKKAPRAPTGEYKPKKAAAPAKSGARRAA
jgi:predicted HicB family RNase H-like nuclease